MRFINPVPEKIYPGLVIDIEVRPLLNIPMKMQTTIREVQDGEYFTDDITKGPFKRWHHQHLFREIKGGSEVVDQVEYELPFGMFSVGIDNLILSKQLEHMFRFRRQTLANMFGQIN